MPRRDPTRDRLDALHAVAKDPEGEAAGATLREALASGSAPVIARAARIVAEARLHGFEQALLAAYGPLFTRPVKRDPGCNAKLAIAEALDLLDHMDADPFLRGAGHAQPEPSWGPPVDSATGLRARCGHALVRMAWPDALAVLADLLADPEARVREEAARALAHHGSPGAQAVLRHKLRADLRRGDEEPAVVETCMAGLLHGDVERGLEVLAPLLDGPDADLREMAAFALAGTRDPAVLPALGRLLEAAVLPADRKVAATALAVHRTEPARALLLAAIRRGGPAEARCAVEALAVQRFDPRVEALVRQAAAENPDVDLDRDIATAFGA